MLDSDQINDRLLFLRRLREITAEQIQQQIADQQQAWKLLLEEKNRDRKRCEYSFLANLCEVVKIRDGIDN